MELPFLEISIVSTTEQTLTDIDILQQIGQAFTDIFLRDFHIYQQAGKNILKIEFESLTDFEQLYAGSLRVHEYLFEHIVHEDLNFDFIKEASMKNNADIDTFVVENYLVLIYHSNYLQPMKINYRLAASFNQLMGFYVSYEEIDNGFIRFLHTKEDYLRLLTATDKKKDWETLFLQKNIDLSHPTIQKFFQIVDKMNDLKF